MYSGVSCSQQQRCIRCRGGGCQRLRQWHRRRVRMCAATPPTWLPTYLGSTNKKLPIPNPKPTEVGRLVKVLTNSKLANRDDVKTALAAALEGQGMGAGAEEVGGTEAAAVCLFVQWMGGLHGRGGNKSTAHAYKKNAHTSTSTRPNR